MVGLASGVRKWASWESRESRASGEWQAPGGLLGLGVLLREAGTEYGFRRPAERPSPGGAQGSDYPGETGSPDETGSLEELEHEIATLSAHVHAAEHRLLILIAEFDRREGWKRAGHPSCAEWLHFRTGIDRGAARERVRAAHALARLPQVSVAMSRGELSFSKVRALTRLADSLDPRGEGDLVEFARQATAAELEKLVRGWKLLGRADEAELERRRHATRTFSVFPDEDGMYVVRGRLDPEVGALLMRAVEAAADALHRPGATWAAEGGSRGPRAAEVTPGQRRADAVGLLAERALKAGFGEEGAGGGAGAGDGAEAGSGSRAERYQVILHVDAATLEGGTEPGRSHLEDGTRVSAETSKRLSCDAAVVRVSGKGQDAGPGGCDSGQPVPTHRNSAHPASTHRHAGNLDIGRRTRTIPPAIRRALELRDGGCRFPGCGLRFTEAHHIQHWADGGETKLGNLLLLCRSHHRALHEEGFSVRLQRDGTFRFHDRTGWPLPDRAPPSPELPPRAVESLVAGNRSHGADPDGWTCASRWRSESAIPWVAEAAVREALER